MARHPLAGTAGHSARCSLEIHHHRAQQASGMRLPQPMLARIVWRTLPRAI
jgi:hypothetical protein